MSDTHTYTQYIQISESLSLELHWVEFSGPRPETATAAALSLVLILHNSDNAQGACIHLLTLQ